MRKLPSRPAVSSDVSDSHSRRVRSAVGCALLIRMRFIGDAMLQIMTFVSSDPLARCLESGVQARALTLEAWNFQWSIVCCDE